MRLIQTVGFAGVGSTASSMNSHVYMGLAFVLQVSERLLPVLLVGITLRDRLVQAPNFLVQGGDLLQFNKRKSPGAQLSRFVHSRRFCSP